MRCSHRLGICVSNTPRRYLVTNTKWTCRLPATLLPPRDVGSGYRRGVGGRGYFVGHEVPPVFERRTECAPVGAVRPCPIRVEPRPGAAPDVAGLERAHAGLGRPSPAWALSRPATSGAAPGRGSTRIGHGRTAPTGAHSVRRSNKGGTSWPTK